MKLSKKIFFIYFSICFFTLMISSLAVGQTEEFDKKLEDLKKEKAEIIEKYDKKLEDFARQKTDLKTKISQKVGEARTAFKEAKENQDKGDYDTAYVKAERVKALKLEILELKEKLANIEKQEEETKIAKEEALKKNADAIAKVKEDKQKAIADAKRKADEEDARKKAEALAQAEAEAKALAEAKSKAEKRISKAKSMISQAEDQEADKLAQEELANAKASLLTAESSFEQEEYTGAYDHASESIKYSQACLDKIAEIRRKEEEDRLRREEIDRQRALLPILIEKGKYLIKTNYQVRLIPERRDCLWRIAEYEFIFNNPWKWPVIYQANKEQIKDPHMIFPGQLFDIPGLDENGNPLLSENKEFLKDSYNIRPSEIDTGFGPGSNTDGERENVPANSGVD